MRQHHRNQREAALITEDQRESYERSVVELKQKAAKFSTGTRPWIAVAHLESANIMQKILDRNPRPEPEEINAGNEA